MHVFSYSSFTNFINILCLKLSFYFFKDIHCTYFIKTQQCRLTRVHKKSITFWPYTTTYHKKTLFLEI